MSYGYLLDDRYASDRMTLIRAYHTLEGDLQRLFEYVEPASENLHTYSHRLFELLLRACTEFEANSKAILRANAYTRVDKRGRPVSDDWWNIRDFHKLNLSSRLSDYHVKFGIWRDGVRVFEPFADWTAGHSLAWYSGYNKAKHDRSESFSAASLEHVINAVSGCLVILFSQFWFHCLSTFPDISSYTLDDNLEFYSRESTIFAVKPPMNWDPAMWYSFDWCDIKDNPNPFGQHPF